LITARAPLFEGIIVDYGVKKRERFLNYVLSFYETSNNWSLGFSFPLFLFWRNWKKAKLGAKTRTVETNYKFSKN